MFSQYKHDTLTNERWKQHFRHPSGQNVYFVDVFHKISSLLITYDICHWQSTELKLHIKANKQQLEYDVETYVFYTS